MTAPSGRGVGQTASAVNAQLAKSDASVQASRGSANSLQQAVDTLMTSFHGDTAVATSQVHAAIANELAALLREMEDLNDACKQNIQRQLSNDDQGAQVLRRITGGTHVSTGPADASGATTTLNGMNN